MTDDRAVSAVLGYVLVLGIVTLLVSGLFVAAGDFVEDQHERAVRAEFEVIGNRVAADIAAVDRLALAAGTGPNSKARLRTDLPSHAAGKSYDMTITDLGGSGVYAISLAMDNPPVTVEVRVKTATTLVESTVEGGDVVVVFDGTQLEVRDA